MVFSEEIGLNYGLSCVRFRLRFCLTSDKARAVLRGIDQYQSSRCSSNSSRGASVVKLGKSATESFRLFTLTCSEMLLCHDRVFSSATNDVSDGRDEVEDEQRVWVVRAPRKSDDIDGILFLSFF